MSAAAAVWAREGGEPLSTEFRFELPLGYVDPDGERHREGIMRLATARDEILPMRDARVRDNEAYLTVLVLSRVLTRLGGLHEVTPAVIEGLFTADLAFLQDLYRRLNQEGHSEVGVACPACRHEFSANLVADAPGGSR